jgi:hypothetical protein
MNRMVQTWCVLTVLQAGALPMPGSFPRAPMRWMPGAIRGCQAPRLRLRGGQAPRLRLRGGSEEEGEEGMGDSSQSDSASSSGSVDAASNGALGDSGDSAAEEPGEAGQVRKRQRQGPKGDPTGKRKHRGRRGGKLAKAIRAKRAAVPLGDDEQREIEHVATTLAEICAAAPHVVEPTEPSLDGDPAMRFINPSQFDGLDDITRSTLYDERQELLDIGPDFSARLSGTTPPAAWMQTWFPSYQDSYQGVALISPHVTASGGAGGGGGGGGWGGLLALPTWANRTLVATRRVVAAYNNLSKAIAAASDPFALLCADFAPAHAVATSGRSWLHVQQGDYKVRTNWRDPLVVEASSRLLFFADVGARIWANWHLSDETEGIITGAALLHEGLGEWLSVGDSLQRPLSTDDALCIVHGGPWVFAACALRAVEADALQVLEWGSCQLIGCFVGGLAGVCVREREPERERVCVCKVAS